LLSPSHYRKAAFMKLPDIIPADEPDENLDSRMGDEVLALLKEPAARFEQTILIVTPIHAPQRWQTVRSSSLTAGW
jgi:ABC-type lipoprotein export system ATPase subunit